MLISLKAAIRLCLLGNAIIGGSLLADETLYYNCTPVPTSTTSTNAFNGKLGTWPPATSTNSAMLPQSSYTPAYEPYGTTGYGYSQTSDTTTTNQPDRKSSSLYLVEKGDTLYAVMRKTGIPSKEIININRLPPPYNLRAGQSLKLASETSSTYSASGATEEQVENYLVRVGDTLYSIARQTGISVKRIISLNQLPAPYGVNAGQQLKLR